MFLFSNLENHPYFTESIYNLVDQNMPKYKGGDKSDRYRSKFNSVVKEEFNSAKSTIPRTMGYMQTPLRTPQDYLKKHSRDVKTDHSKSIPCLCRNRSSKECSLSRIPKMSALLPDSCKKNYIQENIHRAAERPSTAPAPRRIDSRKGDSFVLEESGWVPKYTHKEDYGKIPSYLVKIQRNLDKSRLEFKRFITAEDEDSQAQRLSLQTKEAILEGLVKNLKELLKRYLKLPLDMDTPMKIKRKEEMERRIDALQRDIDLIRENKDILVVGKWRREPSFCL